MFARVGKAAVDDRIVPHMAGLVAGRFDRRAADEARELFRFDACVAAGAQDQSSVQQVIGELAVRLAIVHADAIDETIIDGLRQIAELLQCDRAAILSHDAGKAGVVVSHFWTEDPQPSPSEPLPLVSIPFVASKLKADEASCFTRITEVLDAADREALLRHEIGAMAVIPVGRANTSGEWDFLVFSSRTEQQWEPAIIERLRHVSGVFGQALVRKTGGQALQRAHDELHRLRGRLTEEHVRARPTLSVLPASHTRDQLQAANLSFRGEVRERSINGAIIGQSSALRLVLDQVEQVAITNASVLLLGETGTGKELLATYLHELSARRGRAMVRVNCAAVPTTLIESELFGREKGAFTGALARQIGRFELADRSTIFLDEIGDLPLDVQIKLLRVLEERQIERLGSPKPIHVDVRIVAATHRNLEQRILENAFREDLFYRLNVFPVHVPPLRDRAEDIPLLVWRFVDEFSNTFGKRIDAIPQENMAALQQYHWPGNIRELRNVVERAMIVATGTQLTIGIPTLPGPAAKRSVKIADVEKEHIRSIVESCGWRIRGSGGAAERLGLRPTTLETRMSKLGLSRPKRCFTP